MHKVYTEIAINAPAEVVSKVLYQFQKYPKWNSFIIQVETEKKDYSGNPGALVGEQLSVILHMAHEKQNETFIVDVTTAEPYTLSWNFNYKSRMYLHGERVMVIEPINANKCIFKNYENFSGLKAVALDWTSYFDDQVHDYARMNCDLQKVCEEVAAKL